MTFAIVRLTQSEMLMIRAALREKVAKAPSYFKDQQRLAERLDALLDEIPDEDRLDRGARLQSVPSIRIL